MCACTERVPFPSVDEIANALRAVDTDVGTPTADLPDDDRYVDVRLQVYPDGGWAIRVGDSSYDLDHRGFWGASLLPCNGGEFDAMDVAQELRDQAEDDYAQGEV